MDGYFVLEITWEGASAKSETVVAWHRTARDAHEDCIGRKKMGPDGEDVSFVYAPTSAFDVQIQWKERQ